MKKLFKFFWDCGRCGHVSGIFVATQEQLDSEIGKQVYFGEILGKHSEIYGDLDEGDCTVLTEDQDFIEKFEQYLGGSVGYNPLEYIEEDDNEE